MSVPIPTTTSLLWPDSHGLPDEDSPLRGTGVSDRSGQAELTPVSNPATVNRPVSVSDADLLREFVEAKSGTTAAQLAMTRIVERHGSMVYQVALRRVSDRHLADDVFQATFLVLAQSARKIQRSGSLASWLHGTARNIGRRALDRKHATGSEADSGVEMVTSVEDDPFSEMMRSHERQLLDEELQQLPEIHRAPLVLHYLEERSHHEISQLLGITVSAVESRMKRAKQELRTRLVRRGITLSVAVAALGAATSVASAAPPAALVSSTISLAASGAAVGTSLTATTATTAIQLAGKELAAMSAASKATAMFVGAAGTLTVSGAVLLGAISHGLSDTGTGASSASPVGVVGTDTGLGETEETRESLLLAQADDAKLAGTGEKEDAPEGAKKDDDAPSAEEKEDSAEKPDDTPTPDAKEKNDDAPVMTDERDDVGKGSENTDEARIRSEGPFVAKFRQLSDIDRKIYSSLEEVTALEFPDNTIKEVLEFIGTQHNLNIRIDEQALTDAGLDSETRMNMIISGITLSSALTVMLENINGTQLDYYVDEGILFITTAEKMQGKIRLRYYDLLGDGEDEGIENFAQAVEKYATGPTLPSEVFVTSFGDSLAIRASLAKHKEIEEFIAGAVRLADKRRAAGKPLPVVPPTPPARVEPPTPPAPPEKPAGGRGFGGG